ncbi:MAG TPA: peptidoglycan DD-metalloendopeptidase family protein, partial [Planctomycetota bacterium]|nr:peptidoglycan DD-metalloendopeptidase family protein [Planctomycetota bacterium]
MKASVRTVLLLAWMTGGAPALPPGGPSINGIWKGSVGGHTKLLALVERADGRLLGYHLESPGSWITGGQRTGPAVTLAIEGRDPMHPSLPGTFTGTLTGSHLSGTLTDPDGTTAVTLDRFHPARTVVHWLLAPGLSGDSLIRAMRVEKSNGDFMTGGFTAQNDCTFLACGGRLTAWTVSGANHTILTESGGACTSASTLTGTWDPATHFVSGLFSTTSTCLPAPVTGDFIAGKEGLTSTGDVMDVLRMLRTFADRIESESPSAANAFASTYMHDGKTKADWQAQLAALFAAYDSLHVTIDAVKQIFTFNDADVHPMVLAPPRVEWHLSVTGVPAGGGPVATVLDLTSAFAGDPQLFWIGYEGGNAVFVGNGYTSPFSISMPVQPGDSARSVYGLWPLYVHGGGHPEGHPGWDVEFAAGAKVRASADGVIDQIVPNLTFPGQVDVRVKHRPGITTQYGHIGALEPGLAVGSPVVAGQAVGAAGNAGGHFMSHFALTLNTGVVCPLDYLNPSGLALFTTIWETAAYAEELAEPFPCNVKDVAFPRTRAWTRT